MSERDRVFVPGGTARLGCDAPGADHHPAWTAEVAPFFMDRRPVTCARYREFVTREGYPPPLDWPDGKCPDARLDHPVVFVSALDAEAYARWAGLRLPTEIEWEYAARGPEGRIYPWGNEWRDGACNLRSGVDLPVGCRPEGATPLGIEDLLGTVWQWTADAYEPYPGGRTTIHSSGRYRVIRGGAAHVFYSWPDVRTAYERGRLFARGRNAITGFRCVRSAEG